MLTVKGNKVMWNDGSSRRDFLTAGAASLMGLTLADWFRMKAAGLAAEGKAKSVIQLWMAGVPTQTDTFDPKPQAGEDYSGPLRRPIGTNVAGVQISELLPLLAKQADKYTIIRSLTHNNNSHETAAYIMQTCTMPTSELVYPAMGAVVALKKGNSGTLPPYVTLTNPLGRFSEAGFLGNNYKTFAPGGDPNSANFRVQGIVPPKGMTEARMEERRSLLKAVDTLARDTEQQPEFKAMDEYQEKAYSLILGGARKAFDLSLEKDAVRDKYGRNMFGQSCLLARRLVEAGVPFVTVNDGGWDTHVNNFEAMNKKLPILDGAYAALLADLADRGLLSSTIVTWYGEFGRTPKVAMEPPWFGGRHHYGNCFSAVVSGGGFKHGMVLGATDTRGENLVKRPVYPWDLSATMYKMLGIDPAGRLPHPQGCTAYVTPLGSGNVQSGGLLTELV